jgi:type 1 glutamine amidotransferase
MRGIVTPGATIGGMTTALMVSGGWDGHDPHRITERFAGFLRREGVEVVVSGTRDSYCDAALMARVDLIVHNWTDFMPPEKGEWSRAVQEAVKNGCGLAGWHGGLCDAFRGDCGWLLMTGGQFIGHPNHGAPYDVTVTDRDHPITAGLTSFRIDATEQYYMAIEPGIHVLATTTFGEDLKELGCQPGALMPVAWTRRWGAGRVFYQSIGHSLKDFDVPQVATMTERGLLWAARGAAAPSLKTAAARV